MIKDPFLTGEIKGVKFLPSFIIEIAIIDKPMQVMRSAVYVIKFNLRNSSNLGNAGMICKSNISIWIDSI